MSRETYFKEGAWLGGYEYSNDNQLERDIEEKKEMISYFKERLLAMAIATPKDVVQGDDNPLESLHLEFREIWRELEDELVSLGFLYFVKNNIEYIDNGEV